jgi:tetratricopeptide (TPR) repeat protein
VLVQAAALEQLGDLDGARLRYVEAIRMQPLNWRAWYELGRFEEAQEAWVRAIPPLERAAQLDPMNPLPAADLALARSRAT